MQYIVEKRIINNYLVNVEANTPPVSRLTAMLLRLKTLAPA